MTYMINCYCCTNEQNQTFCGCKNRGRIRHKKLEGEKSVSIGNVLRESFPEVGDHQLKSLDPILVKQADGIVSCLAEDYTTQ